MRWFFAALAVVAAITWVLCYPWAAIAEPCTKYPITTSKVCWPPPAP